MQYPHHTEKKHSVHAVKRLNRFLFYFLGFHLPLSGNMARMYKIIRENNLLDSSFLQLLTNLSEIYMTRVTMETQCNVTVFLNFSFQSSPQDRVFTGALLFYFLV